MDRDRKSDGDRTRLVVIDVPFDDAAIQGVLHLPDQPKAGLALTHGAGGNANSPMLRLVAERLGMRGVAVLRYNLPFRVKRASGPPSRSAAGVDRAGIATAVELVRSYVTGPVLVGGHSYGGRQASMLAADQSTVADGLVLFSYPLHPPGKPERARTEHLPAIAIPSLFVHGDRDPFGSLAELHAATELIPARVRLLEVAQAGHDLGGGKKPHIADDAVDAIVDMFGIG
ncbi:alpha/beta hydrolase family protein [Hoyosella subflava]|uniref:KANL3/Tex30 alpha/beta hydrolase-like domain-containing protein n=1 Tax=Hoyosella subflava (strain DSM 45089 / JCM 17490 / NBRC 109087 / DQS3-9A1) TaxID=443218 RepID=F6EHY7_HOYSD|nr:alpha/beta family hydrolase [Hoyosella subflava]AEF39936.1 hypothetical protein AS9A_1484 [Hoyosella subflava DQS3-9A1]